MDTEELINKLLKHNNYNTNINIYTKIFSISDILSFFSKEGITLVKMSSDEDLSNNSLV